MIFLFSFEISPQKFFSKKQFLNIILLSTNLLDSCHDVCLCMCAYAYVFIYFAISYSYVCICYKELLIIIIVIQGTN